VTGGIYRRKKTKEQDRFPTSRVGGKDNLLSVMLRMTNGSKKTTKGIKRRERGVKGITKCFGSRRKAEGPGSGSPEGEEGKKKDTVHQRKTGPRRGPNYGVTLCVGPQGSWRTLDGTTLSPVNRQEAERR